ncbi:ComEC/Rec2 family competence protein, partial [Candidatus Kaiserbacteria bacterium]|nr:ComEC/Rec2 family competence protein [Candidatus Kaiserbacteria bacterium]
SGRGRRRPPQGARDLGLAAVCLCVALGILRFDLSTWNERDALFEARLGENVALDGVIVREVDERANTAHLTIRAELVDGVPVDRLVLVIADRFPEFGYGDRVRAEGKLEKPEAFETDLGRTFDYPGYLSVRGITYVMPFAKVEKIENGEKRILGASQEVVDGSDRMGETVIQPEQRRYGEGNPILASLLDIKHAFMRQIEMLLPEPQAGLAEGLVLGVKRALGKDLENAFRDTGVIHIIVLSGYNITIVVEAVMRLLACMRLRARVVVGALAIAAFALAVGFSATVLRASLMAGLVLVARATGRTYNIMRALMFAGVVMLLFNPKLLVFDPGFQLSFLATLGLVLVAPILEKKFIRMPTQLQIREFVTSTIATQILVLPLLLYSTGILSVVALFVNVLVLPVVPFTMLLVCISTILGFVSGFIALPVAFCAHLLLSYIIGVVEWFAGLPFAAFSVPAFPFWIVGLSYLLIAVVLWRVYERMKTKPPAPKEPVVAVVKT